MLVIQSQQDRGTGACQKMRKTEQNQFLLITLGITIDYNCVVSAPFRTLFSSKSSFPKFFDSS